MGRPARVVRIKRGMGLHQGTWRALEDEGGGPWHSTLSLLAIVQILLRGLL